MNTRNDDFFALHRIPSKLATHTHMRSQESAYQTSHF